MPSGSHCASRSETASASGSPRRLSVSVRRIGTRLLTEIDVDLVIDFRHHRLESDVVLVIDFHPRQLESGVDLAMTLRLLVLATDVVLAMIHHRSESVPDSATDRRYHLLDPD